MQKFLEATGENRDAAIANALRQLGLDRDDVSVEVLDNGKKGFLGIGATPARVRVTYEAPEIIEEKKVDNKIPVLTRNEYRRKDRPFCGSRSNKDVDDTGQEDQAKKQWDSCKSDRA